MSYTKLRYHIIFATKSRRPLITSRVEPALYECLRGAARRADGRIFELGGVPDHVHLIAGIRAKTAVSDFVRRVKCESSREIEDACPWMSDFAWQVGFGAFTIDPFDSLDIRNYVQNQKTHHANDTTRERYEAIDRDEIEESEEVESERRA